MARSAVAPLETLYESKREKPLPLPPALAHLYGNLRMPIERARPHVVSNFVETLDGVVSFNVRGHASGGDVSGFNAQDRIVLGLLRAISDAVIVGTGTLRAEQDYVWTSEEAFPDLADEYRRLRVELGKRGPPINAIVTGSGNLDLNLRVFASGEVPTVVVTTTSGANRLCKQSVPQSVDIRAVRSKGTIRAASIIEQVCNACAGKLLLVEGGPQLLGHFYAEHLVDEQFLTVAPQIAGRKSGDGRLSLVMGRAFWPRAQVWTSLVDVRRGGSYLFLRYSLN